MNLEIDQAIRRLSAEHPASRPFICAGSPMGCDVALVGINPATDTPFWPYWHKETGFDRSGWLADYARRHAGKRTPTRNRIEQLVIELTPLRLIELNLYSMPSASEVELPLEHRCTDLFDYMLVSTRPRVLLVHGKSPRKHLEKLLMCRLTVDEFTSCIYRGSPLLVFAAERHFAYLPGGSAAVTKIAARITERLNLARVLQAPEASVNRISAPLLADQPLQAIAVPRAIAPQGDADGSPYASSNRHPRQLTEDELQLAWDALKHADVVLRRWTQFGATGSPFCFRISTTGRGESIVFLRDGVEVKSASLDRFAQFYKAWRSGRRRPDDYRNEGHLQSKAQVIHFLMPVFEWLERTGSSLRPPLRGVRSWPSSTAHRTAVADR